MAQMEKEDMDDWKQRLAALRNYPNPEGDKWLQVLYNSYLNRFLSDNNRIWSTGQWMIPLSLAPLAAIPSLKTISFIRILFLAIPSISLSWIWLIIAENHRAYQNKSIKWLRAIEKVLDVARPGGPMVSDGSRLVQLGMIRKMRWVLAYGITTIWLVLLILLALGVRLEPADASGSVCPPSADSKPHTPPVADF